VHAGDHDIELAQQVVPLIERAVLEDVDLDAGQDAERGELGVQPADELELRAQQLGGQPGGHGQPRRVVGERDPLVTDVAGRLGHLLGRAAAVGPVRVRVAVPAQRGPQRGRVSGRRLPEQPAQIVRFLAAGRLGDGFGGGRAYPGQRLQRALAQPLIQLAGREIVHHLGRPPEGPHAVGRRAGPLELERDLPQCLRRIHLSSHTPVSPHQATPDQPLYGRS
jgi:hypothetical protein